LLLCDYDERLKYYSDKYLTEKMIGKIPTDLNKEGRIEKMVVSQSVEMRSSPGSCDIKTEPLKVAENSHFESPDIRNITRVVEGSVRVMRQMMEFRDSYTAGHQSRVSQICVEIAGRMGLPAFKIKGLELAALVHDVGKLAIPSEILNKPGQLTTQEFDLIKTHPMVGYDIMKSVEFPWPVAKTVLQHHERMDGSGYPGRLFKQNILLEARVLGVADVIEAMSSNRPYRPALGISLALEEICLNKGRLYDGDVVDASLEYYAASGYKAP
jgi:HD-GYP domain-containing protein (c-di-GMP phosphodiesterase class II)